MKLRKLFWGFLIVLSMELAALFVFAAEREVKTQDAVSVNEAVRLAERDFRDMRCHKNKTGLSYVVLDLSGNVLFRTEEGLSESINAAVLHRDTILDLTEQGAVVGKIIFYNDSAQMFFRQKRMAAYVLAAVLALQCVVGAGYAYYLNRTIVKPFQKLQGFAQRVAGGNLDVPLEMDRKNLFGAFTESFDIMRFELKEARRAQAQANREKKELVAKLSHDIKTPVASIKAASEVGAALAGHEKVRENYIQIIRKADQINMLITNLFTASLEELQQLPVTPEDMESEELFALLANADYLHRANTPEICKCLLSADKLRLQQVFDNIFANSYKYADTPVLVSSFQDGGFLSVVVEDDGGGVSTEELPLIKEKFFRGGNAKHAQGAGLGLYISDYFMKEMQGELVAENGKTGLKVTVRIALSVEMRQSGS